LTVVGRPRHFPTLRLMMGGVASQHFTCPNAVSIPGASFDSMMERGPKVLADLACWTDEAI